MTEQGSRLRAGVGVVVCVGGAVASLDGEADVILLLLLLQLFLQLLLFLEGTSLHSVFRGHGGVAACPVLLQGRAPLWVCSTSVLQPLVEKRRKQHSERPSIQLKRCMCQLSLCVFEIWLSLKHEISRRSGKVPSEGLHADVYFLSFNF